MNKPRKTELLAPVGSYESLRAAINAGCDSAYFGVTHLNMRARSSAKFELEDLRKIVKICHDANVKAYLTVNTLIYDHDLKTARGLIDAAKDAGIDAIIAADTAMILSARSQNVEVHISTQLSVSNTQSVKFWSKYADTIVLARELTIPMIKRITQQIEEQNIKGPGGNPVKIECFAHGAMCISISGRCGMSLYTTGASANRGACKQACRKPYVVTDKESGAQLEIDNEYVMSPQDICTIDFLDELVNAGVSVLKIEGRGRSPDYVDEVIRCYREALTAIDDGTYTPQKIAAWKKRLESVYNRGLSSGYYLGRKQGWSKVDGSKALFKKVYVGRVEKYFRKAGVFDLLIQDHEIKIGDSYKIIGPTTGVLKGEVKEMRDDDEKEIASAGKASLVSIKCDSRVRKNDKLYILCPSPNAISTAK